MEKLPTKLIIHYNISITHMTAYFFFFFFSDNSLLTRISCQYIMAGWE